MCQRLLLVQNRAKGPVAKGHKTNQHTVDLESWQTKSFKTLFFVIIVLSIYVYILLALLADVLHEKFSKLLYMSDKLLLFNVQKAYKWIYSIKYI